MSIPILQPRVRHPDLLCASLGERQHGVVSREQAITSGFATQDLYRRVKTGAFEVLLPNVYRLPGTHSSWSQRVMAASLWVGGSGAVADLAAARVHRLECIKSGLVTITTTNHLRRPAPWVVVRQVKRLDPCDVMSCGGVTVTTIGRTLMDLGTRIHESIIEEAIDEAIRRDLTSIAELRSTMRRLAKRGRNGSAALRRLLEIRDPTQSIPESVLERRLLRILQDAGLPSPTPQFEVRDEGGLFLARVDVAYPESRIAIEADSRTHHFGRRAWERDLERRSRLAAAGWVVIHISWLAVRTRPREVAAQVRKALRTAFHQRNLRVR